MAHYEIEWHYHSQYADYLFTMPDSFTGYAGYYTSATYNLKVCDRFDMLMAGALPSEIA